MARLGERVPNGEAQLACRKEWDRSLNWLMVRFRNHRSFDRSLLRRSEMFIARELMCFRTALGLVMFRSINITLLRSEEGWGAFEMRTTFLTVLLLSVFMVAHSQTHGGMQMGAGIDKPATLVSGMGSLHHPVSTTNPEAQKFFDQGLSFVYAFNHDEAVKSFKRAAEFDLCGPSSLVLS